MGLRTNTHIEKLLLPLTNLQASEGPAAAALSKNTTLRILNIDSCGLNKDSIKLCAEAIMSNEGSALEEWRVNNQKGAPALGWTAEEAIAKMMQGSRKITKLGCAIQG